MIDLSTVENRVARLEHELAMMADLVARGRDEFLAHEPLRLACERALQLAIQVCIDVGAHIVAGLALGPPDDYSDVFERLARGAGLDHDLAERLKSAAKQRNVLVHLYLDINPDAVWSGLESAGDLRDFGRWAVELARRNEQP